jgi:hypothetical protein
MIYAESTSSTQTKDVEGLKLNVTGSLLQYSSISPDVNEVSQLKFRRFLLLIDPSARRVQ